MTTSATSRPDVSVLMTIYNPGLYLTKAVDSLLAQTHRNFELIAIENGSTDGAKEIIRDYAVADPRLKVFDLPSNIGRTTALNLGLSHAAGEFIAVLDADDMARPTRLEKQISYLRANPQVVVLGTCADFVNHEGKLIEIFRPPLEPDLVRQSLIWQNPFVHSSVMYRRLLALEVGGYPINYPYGHDYALWLALASQGNFANLPERLAVWHIHQTNTSLQPAITLSRLAEIITLFELAANLGGYSAESYRRGRQTRGIHRAQYGIQLCLSGQMKAGLQEMMSAILLNPWCLKDVPELRSWTGITLLSRIMRKLRGPRVQKTWNKL